MRTQCLVAQGVKGFLGIYLGFSLGNKLTGLFASLDGVEKYGYTIDNTKSVVKNGALLLRLIVSTQVDALKPLLGK